MLCLKPSDFRIAMGALLAALLLILCVTLMPTYARADTEGEFTYTISNGQATVTKYTGTGEEVTIPATLGGCPVTTIGYEAFYECDTVASVVIPDGVTEIGDYAFHGSRVTAVTIPNSVLIIGDFAFLGCSKMQTFTIPDSVTSIGDGAFRYCDEMTSLTIGKGVKSIGYEAFSSCVSLKTVVIPDGVTSIGDSAFYFCSGLTSVTISDTVTSIGESAFAWCRNLTSVTLPDSLIAIGDDAFYNCNNLEYNTFDVGNYLGNSTNPYAVLVDTTSEDITALTIHPDTKCIGPKAVYYCKNLTSLTIPDGVNGISNRAFYGCSGMTDVTIGKRVQRIGTCAFEKCDGLTSVTIPESVTHIDDSAFAWCSSLASVEIPDSVKSIGDFAFGWCYELQYNVYGGGNYLGNSNNPYLFLVSRESWDTSVITVHKDTRFIDEEAVRTNLDSPFDYLNEISVEEENPYFAGEGCALFNKDRSVLICVLKGVSGSYTIPDSVTAIDAEAFAGCKQLTSIYIPDTVKTVDVWAFSGCESLANVYYQGTEAQWNGIDIAINTGNDYLTNATIHYESVGMLLGDMSGDGEVTDADAVYLLRYTLFPEEYPLTVNGDVNCDGEVTDADAVYLLRYTLFPEEYPLYPQKEEV